MSGNSKKRRVCGLVNLGAQNAESARDVSGARAAAILLLRILRQHYFPVALAALHGLRERREALGLRVVRCQVLAGIELCARLLRGDAK